MPIYTYVEIKTDGSDGATFEIEQALSDPPLTRHPLTGTPLRRAYSAPSIVSQYSDGEMRRRTRDEAYLAAHGFTRYERDPATGVYHKTAGTDPAAPETLSKPRGDELLPTEDLLLHGDCEKKGGGKPCTHGNDCTCGHCH